MTPRGGGGGGVLLVVVTYFAATTALPSCVCTREMKPVCGSDGHTYNNMCLLECQKLSNRGLQIKSQGHCRHVRAFEDCFLACSFDYTPVCGTNGVTYHNRCALDCEGSKVRLAHEGECRVCY